nr:unnamed protein product [Gossypium raimondii]
MGLQLTMGKGALPGRGLGKYLQGWVEVPILVNKQDSCGLAYKPDARERKKGLEKKREKRRARLSEMETKWEPMTFPHISKTFLSGGIVYPEGRMKLRKEGPEGWTSMPYLKRKGWKEIYRAFALTNLEVSSDINEMSDTVANSESLFEQDMSMDDPQDFEDDQGSVLSLDLLRMVEEEEKQILPYKESVEIVSLEEGREVKIGACITKETRQDLVGLLQEFKDVFAWSYQDMPGLSTDIVVHRLPIKEECKPVQQKLRRMRPDVLLKIKEEVKKQFEAGFLQVVKYSEWMHSEDMEKTTFVTVWGTFCCKVMPFGLKNAGATYQRAMVTLFHDMMHKEIEVYVDDMIAKSRTEGEHVQVLRKLFLRLRKFQLKLNPAKCTFGARSGKLLRFLVSKKGIEINPDKVKAIQELPPLSAQKEVRGFLGRLNYITRFISQLTEKCDPIFHLLKKHNPGVWDEECQKTLEKVKYYLSNAPAIKGSAIVDFLASRALDDYEPLNFNFPNEDLMYVATTEANTQESNDWKLNFDGASNAVSNGIGAVLVSPDCDHYPFNSKLDFDCTNNMAEYEACIIGIRTAMERKIKMADALATLASMIKVNKQEDVKPIQMSIYDAPAHCCNIDEEEEKDDNPWYQDILRYVKNHEYPNQATENDKRTLRRLASDYVLDGEILYKRGKDQVLLRCVDAMEAKKILEEVHDGVCGAHANGFTMARQIMRFGYYWSTIEGDCIKYAKKCHKCQIYEDKIHVPSSPLHAMTSPWPFSMWGMDVIRPISPKASNGHCFIFVVIDYFTKWVEDTSYANVTKLAVSKFLKKEIICRYRMSERIISDNALNLKNSTIAEVCS